MAIDSKLRGSELCRMATANLTALTVAFAFSDSHTSSSTRNLSELDFGSVGNLPIQIAVLWGNPQNGEFAAMLRFPPNFPGGMHNTQAAIMQ